MLSSSSFNALLKTIEEPPAHVVFILATTELHKVPLTISSRCQTFRFKPISDALEITHLTDLAAAEGIEIEDGAAEIIAKNAGGALRDAMTILDRAISYGGNKITEASVYEMLGLMPKELVEKAASALVNKDAQTLHSIFETLKREGFDSIGLLKDLKKVFGDIFYFSLKAANEPFAGAAALLKKTSSVFIAGITRKISKLIDEIRFSDTPALSAEVGLFTIMESSLDLEHFVNRLTELEAALSGDELSLSGLSEKKTPVEPKPANIAPKQPAKEVFKPEAKVRQAAISDEEPFVAGDYSKDFTDEKEKKKVLFSMEPTDTAKRILNIIDGVLVASYEES
jgi:DNA polymerase-3 subunit gamma/tau